MSVQSHAEHRLNNKCKIVPKNKTNEIKCCNPSCKKTLAFLLDSSDDGDVLYHLSIKCPYCNSKSYDFDVHGSVSWIMADGIKLSNIKEDDKNNRVVWETSR